MRVSPERKRRLPKAKRAPSKKSIIPRSMKRTPAVVRATPISVGCVVGWCWRERFLNSLTLTVCKPHFWFESVKSSRLGSIEPRITRGRGRGICDGTVTCTSLLKRLRFNK